MANETVDEKEYIRTIKGIIVDFVRDNQPKDVAFYQKIYDWLDGRHIEQEQPDTCIFGNTPSEEACKFCGVNCELREPKQSGITSTNLSSTNEAVGLAIMAYLDTKVKHDNAKVCGVSLRVAREWIREKIANKQKQPEVDLEKELDRYLRGEFQQTAGGNFNNYIQVARHFWNMGYNAGKEE